MTLNLIIFLFIITVASVRGQSPDQAVSEVSLTEAQQDLKELERALQITVDRFPAISAKDMFETTRMYEARKAKAEAELEATTKPLRSAIARIKGSYYRSTASRAEFKEYDADAAVLASSIDGTEFEFFQIGTVLAKAMHGSWNMVQVVQQYTSPTSPALPTDPCFDKGYISFGGIILEGFKVCKNESSTEKPRFQRPRILYKVDPAYPESTRRLKLKDLVRVEVVVSERGVPERIRILKSIGFGDEEIVEAVRRWQFSPARRYGKPIPLAIQLSFEVK